MNQVSALAELKRLEPGVFQTSDAAACLKTSNETASKILSRIQSQRLVVRIAHGRWAFPDKVDKLALPEHLTSPWPSYVSLQTALYHHGIVTQIPAVTYAVSLSRTRKCQNSMGTYSIHHVNPGFFFGFETIGKSGIKMAAPEKALLDFLYLGTAKSHLFKKLPEIELSRANFKISTAKEMIEKISSKTRRTLVLEKFEELIRKQRSA